MAVFLREQRHAVRNQSPSGFPSKFCRIVSVDIFRNPLPSIDSLAAVLYFLKSISHACEHTGGYEARVFRIVRADESEPLGPNVVASLRRLNFGRMLPFVANVEAARRRNTIESFGPTHSATLRDIATANSVRSSS